MYMIYSDELYHHGVKGMKWGVRRDNRLRARAEFYDRRADKSRIGMFKRSYKAEAERAREALATRQKSRQTKGLLKKYDVNFGRTRRISKFNSAAKVHDYSASIAKKQKQKTKYKSYAWNARSSAKTLARIGEGYKKKGLIGGYANEVSEVWNQPLKTTKGKNTTAGKQYIKAMLVSAAVSYGTQLAAPMITEGVNNLQERRLRNRSW